MEIPHQAIQKANSSQKSVHIPVNVPGHWLFISIVPTMDENIPKLAVLYNNTLKSEMRIPYQTHIREIIGQEMLSLNITNYIAVDLGMFVQRDSVSCGPIVSESIIQISRMPINRSSTFFGVTAYAQHVIGYVGATDMRDLRTIHSHGEEMANWWNIDMNCIFLKSMFRIEDFSIAVLNDLANILAKHFTKQYNAIVNLSNPVVSRDEGTA